MFISTGLKKRSDIIRFYYTRWARIWPLHLATLGIFILVLLNVYLEEPWKLVCNVLLLQSWVPAYDWAFSYNGVSWSISTEAFFYVMFPFLLLGSQRKFWWKYFLLFAATVACVAILQFGANRLPDSKFPAFAMIPQVNPFMRLFEFATGMAVGHVFMNVSTSARRSLLKDTSYEIASIGLIVGYYWLIRYCFREVPVPPVFRTAIIMASPCFCFAIAIFCFSQSRGAISRVMSTRFMVYLGEISFSFYMIHNIVINAMRRIRWVPDEPNAYWFFGGALAISICSAGLLYAIIEIPCKNGLVWIYDRFSGKTTKEKQQQKKFVDAFAKRIVPVIGLAIFLVGGFYFFHAQRLERYPEPVAREIMLATQLFPNEVHFGKEVILHGVVCEKEYNGKLIRMVWQKKKDITAKRFIHICNRKDEIIYLVKHQDYEAFNKHKAGTIWHDEFYLAPEMLEDAAYIGIGFWDEKSGGARINTGPRSLAGYRLNIYEFIGLTESEENEIKHSLGGSEVR